MACDDLLGLEEALQKLEQKDARKAELVKLRFFCWADHGSGGQRTWRFCLNS